MNKKTKMLISIVFLLFTGCALNPQIKTDLDIIDQIKNQNVYFESVELRLMETFPLQMEALVIGYLSDGCVILDDISTNQSNAIFEIVVETHREGDLCTQALVPFEEIVPINIIGLNAGTYTLMANQIEIDFILDSNNYLVE